MGISRCSFKYYFIAPHTSVLIAWRVSFELKVPKPVQLYHKIKNTVGGTREAMPFEWQF